MSTLRGWIGITVIMACTAGLAATWTVANGTDSGDDLAWAIFFPGGSTTMSGGSQDWKAIGKLKQSGAHDLMYARLGHDRYTIADPAVIKKVTQTLAPADEIDRQQDVIERQQDKLEASRDGLDERHSALEDRSDEIADQSERLAEAAVTASATGERARHDDLKRQLAALRAERLKLADQLDELNAKIDVLEAEQAKLERQHEALDGEHERLYKVAEQDIRQVLRDAVARGLATPLR